MQTSHNHWRFAAAAAFASLNTLTHAFDFEREAGNANYVGITPRSFVEVIDAFLSETDEVVPCGNRRNLIECRQRLTSVIQEAYDRGLAAGGAAYRNALDLRDFWNAEIIRSLAAQSAPADPSIRGWFMEGFCYGWVSAHSEDVAVSLRKEQSD